jgi:hypothetical protein
MSLLDQEYCRLANEQMERERMVESWRVAALTDEERRNEQFERDLCRLRNNNHRPRALLFNEERLKEIDEYATAKWRRLNPEKASASDAVWAGIRAAHEADVEKERVRPDIHIQSAARRRPQVHDAPAKKKATIVNGVLTWA